MFRNANWLTPLAGPFSRAFLTAMSSGMDKPTAKLEQRELTALLHSMGEWRSRRGPAALQRTSAKLYGICLRLLGNPEDAQDVLQSVFLTVWQKAGAFDPPRPVRSPGWRP